MTNTRRRTVQVLLVAAPAVFLAVMAWQHRWVGDDAFINFRIVKEMKAGNGPVFNAGERIEAGTSPLWLMVMFVADLALPLRLEWIAVLLGIGLTITGLVLAQRGAWLTWQGEHPDALFVPFGALFLVALPPMWDYATSGLETGLGLAWLGACFCGIAHRYQRSRNRPVVERARVPLWLCLLIGLGPLVRPDFGIYFVAFLAAAFVVDRGLRWRDRTMALVAAFALPVASEIFRMAYYANLVPNTALAKESGRANWSQGWRYLGNYNRPYWLWLPLLCVAAVVGVAVVRAARARDVRRLVVVGAPVLAALVQALYVVRVGGDFMHARFLLPATFAATLPTSVIPFRGSFRLALAPVAVWAAVCAVALRGPFPTRVIEDERRFWQVNTGVDHPITLDDFRSINGYKNGERARQLEGARQHVLAFGQAELPLAENVSYPVVVLAGSVGVAAYRSPADAYVIDSLALADPIASRFRLGARGRPGHEKLLFPPWYLARFTDSTQPSAEQARRALACDGLRHVIEATTGPLGFSEILRNIGWAPGLTSLRFASEPATAERELCGDAR